MHPLNATFFSGFPALFANCIEITKSLKLLLLYYNMLRSVLIAKTLFTRSLVDDIVYNREKRFVLTYRISMPHSKDVHLPTDFKYFEKIKF